MKFKIGEWEGFTATEVMDIMRGEGFIWPVEVTVAPIAKALNALLAEKLAGAQQVWKTEFDVRPAWTEFQRGTEKKTARLVCIEEIEK